MRTIRFKFATSTAVAFVLTLIWWQGLAFGVFGGAQLRFVDALFQGGEADPSIVVIGIDQESLEKHGRWPWERTKHAALIDRLTDAKAALIGYDILFTEPGSADHDRALAASIKRAGNVILSGAATFEDRPNADILTASRFEPPIAPLARVAAAIAQVNVFPDADGVVRSLPAVVETSDGDLIPTLGLALIDPSSATGALTLRKDGVVTSSRVVQTGGSKLLDINYVGKDAFPVISAADVLDRAPGVADRLRGKIVLVGVTAVGLGDHKLTPIDKSGGQPGVLVHANAANTIAADAYLEAESRRQTLLWVFALAFSVALAVAFLRVWLSPVVAAGLLGLYVLYAFNRFDDGNVVNLVYPPAVIAAAFTAALAVRYFTEFRERRRVEQVFARYVAPDVVDEVLASPKGAVATLRGAERPMSVLFADLRGFTAASEKAQPAEVVAALNVYLDAMTQAVLAEQGTLDKFMGDCVMAFWGAPRAEPNHARRAVQAALRMLDNIDAALLERPEAEKLRVKGCGIGIATGDVVVGNIGSVDRLDYTVIGDTVNTASRLCSVAGSAQIVVGEHTRAALGADFHVAPLPPLIAKGKVEPLSVYQVLRPGQSAQVFESGATLGDEEEKGKFLAQAPVPDPAAS